MAVLTAYASLSTSSARKHQEARLAKVCIHTLSFVCADQEDKTVAHLMAGASFGELALMQVYLHSTTTCVNDGSNIGVRMQIACNVVKIDCRVVCELTMLAPSCATKLADV